MPVTCPAELRDNRVNQTPVQPPVPLHPPPPTPTPPTHSPTSLSRGRKASASSKAPRKGSAARGKSSRSDADSSSQDSDGLLTLFVGAGIALLVAAVSSGGSRGGHGRRREVVRQRTATRAAKTVGSYVEPPQRTAVAALLLHVWGNLKRWVGSSLWGGVCVASGGSPDGRTGGRTGVSPVCREGGLRACGCLVQLVQLVILYLVVALLMPSYSPEQG